MNLIKKISNYFATVIVYYCYYKKDIFKILLSASNIDKALPFTNPKSLDFNNSYYNSLIYATCFLLISKKRQVNLSFKELLARSGIEKAYLEYSNIETKHNKIESWKNIQRFGKYFSLENEIVEFSRFVAVNENYKDIYLISGDTDLKEKGKLLETLYIKCLNNKINELSIKFNVKISVIGISNLSLLSEQKKLNSCCYLLTKGPIQKNTIFKNFILSFENTNESSPCLSSIIPFYIGRDVTPSINLIRDAQDINVLIFSPFVYYILKNQSTVLKTNLINIEEITKFLSNKDSNQSIFNKYLDQCFPIGITNSKAIKFIFSSFFSFFKIQENFETSLFLKLIIFLNENKVSALSVREYLRHFFSFIFEQKTNEFLPFRELNNKFLCEFEKLIEYKSQLQLTGLIDPNNYFFENTQNLQLPIKVAIHFHIYYLDLLSIVVETLTKLPFKFDLFLTSSHSSLLKLKDFFDFKFKNKGRVTVIETPNLGRDVAPWLIEMGKLQDDYDVVGHFHTKKSVIDSQRGARWFRSILSSLLSPKNSQHILTSFYLNKQLGCVVPQPYQEILEVWNEHGVPVIGENLNNVNELLRRMGIDKPFDRSDLFFSVGTMLWYKPSALRPLFNLNLKYLDFGREPLPLDGSLAHAIERLPKIVCVSEGFEIICLEAE